MARSYSVDLRERVVAAFCAGASCRSVAEAFKVSPASVVKWAQLKRGHGHATEWFRIPERYKLNQGDEPWEEITTKNSSAKRCGWR